MTELKPCPFCGGEAKSYARGGTDNCWLNTHWVGCLGCDCGTCFYETEGEAIAAWNRRAGGEK